MPYGMNEPVRISRVSTPGDPHALCGAKLKCPERGRMESERHRNRYQYMSFIGAYSENASRGGLETVRAMGRPAMMRGISKVSLSTNASAVRTFAGQSVKPTMNFTKGFGGASKLVKGVRIGGGFFAIAGGVLEGVDVGKHEMAASGNVQRAWCKGGSTAVLTAGFGYGGMAVGAAIGTAICPGFGTYLGGAIGGFLGTKFGSWLGRTVAGSALDTGINLARSGLSHEAANF